VSEKRPKKDSLEVSSQSLQDELVAIRDRLSAIETIQSISNVNVVADYVKEHMKSAKAAEIMAACEQPRTRSELVAEFSFKSMQALDYHLRPLREADLLRQIVGEDGSIRFGWSNLFRGLPKSRIKELLEP
jgi:DNA-binding transcriptional ArsR family regulator